MPIDPEAARIVKIRKFVIHWLGKKINEKEKRMTGKLMKIT